MSKQADHRKPLFDCTDHPDALELTVYVPGVDATGVEVASHGPDLVVTARKSRFVRVNFPSFHLESAQRDYRLVLRLGNHLDFAHLDAGIQNGVLTLRIPKKSADRTSSSVTLLQQVA